MSGAARSARRCAVRHWWAAFAALAVLSAAARPAAAQWRGEARLDAFAAERAAAHVGAGVERDAGLYARVALVGGVGVARGANDVVGLGARAEGSVRFLVDPLRASRRGVYLGGGGGVRHDPGGGRVRGYLLAVVGVEGPRRGGWAPSVEAGVGGGVRLGLVLRRARAERR